MGLRIGLDQPMNTASISLDERDLKILRILQQDADISMSELGDRVSLSHTPCWRRVKRLQDLGVIQQKVVLLDPQKLQLGVTIFVYVVISSHQEEALLEFENAVQQIREVVECYSMTGEKDYMLKVVVDRAEHYEVLLKKHFAHLPHVASLSSTFALKRIKYTTALPI